MKISWKSFVAGFVSAAVLIPVVYVGSLYAIVRFWPRTNVTQGLEPPVLPTTDAEYDWPLEAFGGGPFHFSELKGKVIFLTVWRPSCPTCEAELPFLQGLYEKIQSDEAIAFVTVATEKSDRILDLVAEYDLSFPIYTSPNERPALYQTRNVPSTFIISPEGKLVYRGIGAARWDDDAAVAYLRGLALGGQDL